MRNKIEFRKKDNKLFLMFWKRFEPKVDKLKNVVIENTNDDIILSYEIPQGSSRLTNKIIKLWLADCMVLYYKENYFKSNLILPTLASVPFNLMVKVLSVFDKATDVDYVLHKMKDLKHINIHSFFVFRLSELRLRWQEVCDLFLKSLPSLIELDAFMELLRYLLLVTEAETKEVNLYIDGEFLFIKDKQAKDLTDPIAVSTDNGCIKAIFELIMLAPQNIRVRFNKNSKPELIGFINNLFTSKVSYCT